LIDDRLDVSRNVRVNSNINVWRVDCDFNLTLWRGARIVCGNIAYVSRKLCGISADYCIVIYFELWAGGRRYLHTQLEPQLKRALIFTARAGCLCRRYG
jgi:hypothetical protein